MYKVIKTLCFLKRCKNNSVKGLRKIELKFIILRDVKLFVDMSGTFPKFPNNSINEINPQKESERLHIQYRG